jgi:hypothetical protein
MGSQGNELSLRQYTQGKQSENVETTLPALDKDKRQLAPKAHTNGKRMPKTICQYSQHIDKSGIKEAGRCAVGGAPSREMEMCGG